MAVLANHRRQADGEVKIGRLVLAHQPEEPVDIGRGGAARLYLGADDVVVFIDGRRAAFGDLRLGDRLLAALDSTGRLQYVEAYRREVRAR